MAVAVVAAAVAAIGYHFVNNAPKPNSVGDAATIIGIVTFGALAIERAVEAFWSLVGHLQNGWWPLNRIHAQITALEANTNDLVTPIFEDATRLLGEARSATDAAQQARIQEAIHWVNARQGDLNAQRENLTKLAANDQRVQLLGTAAFQAVAEVNALVARYGKDLKATTAMANQAIVSATEFAATFKDNPARRLISLGAGMALGMLLTGVVGLDIFAAINETGIAKPYWGVLATGVVIGLGANPTHEVVRVLQEAKKKRKLDNTPVPSAPVMFDDIISAALADTRAAAAPGGDGDTHLRLPREERETPVPAAAPPPVTVVQLPGSPASGVSTFTLRQR